MNDYSKNIRRKDRQKTDEKFIKELLHNSVSCAIAVEKDGHPFIHVAFFIYDEQNNEIVFHFSKYGFAGQVITSGKKASVSVYKYGKLYTAGKAEDFGCEYSSAIIYGKLRIIENEDERMAAMDLFFNKFFGNIPKHSYKPFTSLELSPVHVAKIKIDDWLGKEHRVPEHALDSYYFPADAVLK